MAILVAKILPGLIHGTGGVWLVQRLEAAAEFAVRRVIASGLGRGGAFIADVGYAVQGALAAASAHGEIHRAVVRVDHGVGHAHLRAGHKFFALGRVGGAGRGEKHRGHGAVGPIEAVDGLLVLGRKLGSEAGDHAHG